MLRDVVSAWRGCVKYAGIFPTAEKGGREASACCGGKGRTLFVMPGGKAHAAVDVAVGE